MFKLVWDLLTARILVRIFHEARCARREKCSKFLRCAVEFASASLHLLARILHFRAMFGRVSRAICTAALLAGAVITSATLICGCEYEWREEAKSPEPYPAQQIAANFLEAEQADKPKQAAPPPEFKPVLAPGKDISGQAPLPPKARKLNLLELKDSGELNVTANFIGGDMPQAFDEREDTLAKSEGFNPFKFTFEFSNPRSLKAVRVLSSYSDYSWAVQVDQGERLFVDTIIDGEWSTIAWPDGLKGKRIQVEVLRKYRDNYVHLNEVEIYE